MRKFSIGELKHLKFNLINQKGLSPTQADERIRQLIEFEKGIKKKKKEQKKEKPEKTLKEKLNEDMKRLRGL